MTKSQIILVLGLAALTAGTNRANAQAGGDPRIAGLRSPNPTARLEAIRMITVVGNHTDPGVMQALAQIAIRDPDEKNRVAAVHKVAQVGGMNMHTYAVLSAASSDASPYVRQAAQQYLGAASGSHPKLPVYRVDPNQGHHSSEPVQQRLNAMEESKGQVLVPQRRSQPPVVEWNSPIPDVYRKPEGSLTYRRPTQPNVASRYRMQPGVQYGPMARYPSAGRQSGPRQHVVGYHSPEVDEAGPVIVPESAPEYAPAASTNGPRIAPQRAALPSYNQHSVPATPVPAPPAPATPVPAVAPAAAATPQPAQPTPPPAPVAVSEAAKSWTVPFMRKRGSTAATQQPVTPVEPSAADRAFSPPEPVMAVKSSRWPTSFTQRANTLRSAQQAADRKPDPSAGMAQHIHAEREIEPPPSPSFGKKVLAALPVFSRKAAESSKPEDTAIKPITAPSTSYVGGDVVPLRQAERIVSKPVPPTQRLAPPTIPPRQVVPAPPPVKQIASQPRTFTSLKPPAPVSADSSASMPTAPVVPVAPAVVERAVPPEIAAAKTDGTSGASDTTAAVAIPKAVAKAGAAEIAPPPGVGQGVADSPAPVVAASEPSPKQAERPLDMTQRRRKAQELLAQARQRLQAGAIDEAEAILYQVHEYAVEYRRFDDSPAAVQRAIDAARERLHHNTFPAGF